MHWGGSAMTYFKVL